MIFPCPVFIKCPSNHHRCGHLPQKQPDDSARTLCSHSVSMRSACRKPDAVHQAADEHCGQTGRIDSIPIHFRVRRLMFFVLPIQQLLMVRGSQAANGDNQIILPVAMKISLSRWMFSASSTDADSVHRAMTPDHTQPCILGSSLPVSM